MLFDSNDLLRIMLVLLFASALFMSCVQLRLRLAHQQKWVTLGRPCLFLNRASREFFRFIRYGGDFRQLNDSFLSLLVWLSRACGIGAVAAFVGAIFIGQSHH